MRLDVRALALTFGLLWAVSFLLMAAANQVWPSYGTTFLALCDSLYPGYAPAGWGSVFVGTLYALVDGSIGGAVVAWVYNRLATGRTPAPTAEA
ncbi:MAG: hypothetical protein RRA92_06215 [Gemmatimonadota bacterium]|nr:hypothetical protein [Gemmatimonadota bacterium]